MKDFGWSFTELYCLPVSLRTWIINETLEMTKTNNKE
mgnify:FL=1